MKDNIIYKFVKKSLSFLANFFRVSTDESSARLYSFMIILSGCIDLHMFIGAISYKLLKGTLMMSGGDIALIIGAIASFVAVGVAGKYYTAKTENSINKNQSPQDEQIIKN